jgi:hypothetical protein
VAEDVAKVDPALIVRAKEGKHYSVRYDQVNAMLLNEFLKAHRKVDKQQAMIAGLQSTLASLRKTLKVTTTDQQQKMDALTVGLEKLSAQIGVRVSGPKVIATRQQTVTRGNHKYESAD